MSQKVDQYVDFFLAQMAEVTHAAVAVMVFRVHQFQANFIGSEVLCTHFEAGGEVPAGAFEFVARLAPLGVDQLARPDFILQGDSRFGCQEEKSGTEEEGACQNVTQIRAFLGWLPAALGQ